MLTTIDNPYDPFTQYDEWYNYDTQKGYHTCAYIDRIAISSSVATPEQEALAVENAIDEILSINALGLYKKVIKE